RQRDRFPGLHPGATQRRQQQPDQKGDDRNHHQQLDQRKSDSAAGCSHGCSDRPPSEGDWPPGVYRLSATVQGKLSCHPGGPAPTCPTSPQPPTGRWTSFGPPTRSPPMLLPMNAGATTTTTTTRSP